MQYSESGAYPYLKGTVTLDGNIRKDKIAGMLIVDMDTLDLQIGRAHV